MQWSVPRVWSGTAFVVGGGPSISDLDLSKLKGHRVIAINSAFEDLPFADVCYFMDCYWFDNNKAKLIHFAGLKVTNCDNCEGVKWVKFLKRKEPRLGFSIDHPNCIARGTNSGHGAIDLAGKLGANKIILLGFDMRIVPEDPKDQEALENALESEKIVKALSEGNYDTIPIKFKHNYHSRHKRVVSPAIYKNVYLAEGKGFETTARQAKELGIEIINATPGSALKDFPIVSPDEIIPGLLKC